MSKAILVWGTQLNLRHHSALAAEPEAPVILIESPDICKRYTYHKHKLILILSAMRSFADELEKSGRTVVYLPIDSPKQQKDFWATLQTTLKGLGARELHVMEQNDRPPQAKLEKWANQRDVKLITHPNRLFLTSHEVFQAWASRRGGRLLMENFYRDQRKRLHILMDDSGEPAGGQWNYDHDNRKPLPKSDHPPGLPTVRHAKHVAAVRITMDKLFSDNPGKSGDFWLPTTRRQALNWLNDFVSQRLEKFGDYEDAMRAGEVILYHSVLSPMLNIGLLHPTEVVEKIEQAYRNGSAPLAACEGYVRQIIGWREFMFGMYHYQPNDWKDMNKLKQTSQLEAWWYDGKTDEVPLGDVIERVAKYGYAHHIERLMVLGNYLLLGGYSPQAAYRWFMEMFVDAYQWVMVPNVIGMSQYADGGSFATKPYISGANYLQKMGGWWPNQKAMKQSAYTDLYWDFLDRHRQTLGKNQRLSLVYKQLDRRKP